MNCACQHSVNCFDKHLRIRWLGKERHSPTHGRLIASLSARDQRSEEENRHAAQTGIALEFAGYFTSVFSRHIDIEYDQVRTERASRRQHARGPILDANIEALRLLEEETNERRKIGLIVDDKNTGFSHGGPATGDIVT